MSKKTRSLSEEESKQVTEFTVMLTKVAKLLDQSPDVEDIKKFLKLSVTPTPVSNMWTSSSMNTATLQQKSLRHSYHVTFTTCTLTS